MKVIRELKIMALMGEMSSDLFPELIDVIIPEKEKSLKTLTNIFLVMDYQ